MFFHNDNICLNFELLDQTLYGYIADREKGLCMSDLRLIIHQLTTALYHLCSVGIVHADLKLDNVMVVDRRKQPLKVKLVDFGLAYVTSGKPGMSVQTIGYRTPEVMLDIPFNEAIDMWSLGVIAAELATGYALYNAEQDYDMLTRR